MLHPKFCSFLFAIGCQDNEASVRFGEPCTKNNGLCREVRKNPFLRSIITNGQNQSSKNLLVRGPKRQNLIARYILFSFKRKGISYLLFIYIYCMAKKLNLEKQGPSYA